MKLNDWIKTYSLKLCDTVPLDKTSWIEIYRTRGSKTGELIRVRCRVHNGVVLWEPLTTHSMKEK